MRLTRQHLLRGAGVLTVVVFAALFVHVFRLGSGSGTNFAPYSTYRSDPLGMMALYNALDRLPKMEVERYIHDFDELPDGAESTFVIAGAGLGPDPKPVLDALEDFVVSGGRVVIAFFPINSDTTLEGLYDALREGNTPGKPGDSEAGETAGSDEEKTTTPEAAEETGEKEPAEASSPDVAPADLPPDPGAEQPEEKVMDFGPPLEDISERWAFDYGFRTPAATTRYPRQDDSLNVQPTFEGRSGLYFVPRDDDWKTIYGEAQPEAEPDWAVLMERSIGAGTVVLCSDAFFLSNEALQSQRDPELLAWLLGNREKIYFSETHLGTQQQDRIMTLVRRYRLHGVLFAFLLVGALFVWHHAATLIPRQEKSPGVAPTTQAERSHQDGLDNLLARFIPPGQLLDTCVQEWSQHFHNDPKGPAVRQIMDTRRRAMPPTRGEAELVATYNQIAREIHHK